MPVSHAQFQSMPPATVLQRLVNAKRYLLAMRISEFLGESPHSIVLQWASAKLASSLQLTDRRALLRSVRARMRTRRALLPCVVAVRCGLALFCGVVGAI